MFIHPTRLESDHTITIDQTLPAGILQLDEPTARGKEPVVVQLAVTRDEENVLVTGQVRTVLELCCGRCAEWIRWPIEIPQFLLLLEPPFTDTIDLTPYVREDILLDLPVAAACRLDENNRCPVTGTAYLPAGESAPMIAAETWKELDKIKGREG